MTASASKPRTSPATLLSTRLGSKDAMWSMPLRPATRPSQNAGTSLPSGVMAPMPLTTTRRSAIGQSRAHRLVAGDDDRQRPLHGHFAVHAGHRAHAAEHAAQFFDLDLQHERV